MSLRHAVLGLVAQHPSSGYDLMTLFRSSLAHVWPANQSQVYGELAKLTDAGLLSVSTGGARGRKEFSITGAGRTELERWLVDPDSAPPGRSELLLHIFFLDQVDRPRAEEYLRELHARFVAQSAGYDQLLASRGDWQDGSLETNGRLALEYGRRFARMQVEWAAWAVEQYAARD